jgi:hypothetical protein
MFAYFTQVTAFLPVLLVDMLGGVCSTVLASGSSSLSHQPLFLWQCLWNGADEFTVFF